MAFMFGFILATIGVPLSLLVGLVLLVIPRSRQLSPYAFLLYPSTYLVAVVCFLVMGFLGSALTSLGHSRFEVHPGLEFAADLTSALLVFGGTALGALAGALAGVAMANRAWWRLFATGDQRTRRVTGDWLATPPLIRSFQERLSTRIARQWKAAMDQ